MKYLTGKDRQQIPLFVGCLVEAIEPDNEVRLIDAFVEALSRGDFGFKVDHLENGRPAYHPADLLKLYLYGYWSRSRCEHDVQVFNLRRIFNLLPQNVLQAYLKWLVRIFGFVNALLHASGFDMPNTGPSRTIFRIIFVPRLQPAEMGYIS